MDSEQIRQELKKAEGSGLPGHPFSLYKDSRGLWTIGWGFCIDPSVGCHLPTEVAEFWLDLLIKNALGDAQTFKWFPTLNNVRQNVIICLIYNMGLARFNKFEQMKNALAEGDFDRAADELQNSLWFRELDPHPEDGTERGVRMVRYLRTGTWE